MVCDYKPLKEEKYRVRLTIGGGVLDYNNNASSPTASLLEEKSLLNSVISDAHEGARFMTADVKDVSCNLSLMNQNISGYIASIFSGYQG